jgi:hypothetical protein
MRTTTGPRWSAATLRHRTPTSTTGARRIGGDNIWREWFAGTAAEMLADDDRPVT